MRFSATTLSIAAGLAMLFLQMPSLCAQANDDCFSAQLVVDPANFCSPVQAAHNLFATPSNVPVPNCFTEAQEDVWFWFIAEAPNVVIVINGSSVTPGGSLLAPQVALYEGACDALNLLDCESDPQFFGITELRLEGLVPGNKYFFRVDGEIPGTFQFCVRNFFFGGNISGDCPTAIPLCDKRPFNVPAVAGPGTDPSELDQAMCFSGVGSESNSTWYAFTAANNGTLEFRLTPNNPGDDLDFVVYRLPNGMGNCDGKIIERCMAAGDFTANSPCMGPTGLNAASTGIEHGPGCLVPDDNNFLRYLDVQAGNTYALVVNNFTSSGNGFQVEWGGTVEFTGPTAAIGTDEPDDLICLGDTIRFSDVSTSNQGVITDWGWTFGEGASQNIATTAGPHDIVYQTLGQKIVTLNIKSSLGCEVSATRTIQVEDCCPFTVPLDVSIICSSDSATVSAGHTGAVPPISYEWSNGQQDSVVTVLAPGNYSVTVTDGAGCKKVASLTLQPPIIFTMIFPQDTAVLSGQTVGLEVISNNPELQVQWTNSTGSVIGNPIVVAPNVTETYFIRAYFGDCEITDSVHITVYNNEFYIPNAFTPNNDQANDRFKPIISSGSLLKMSVWSRWGELVYEGTSPEGWDGTFDGVQAPSDVYVYSLTVRLFDGTETERHGDVTLIR